MQPRWCKISGFALLERTKEWCNEIIQILEKQTKSRNETGSNLSLGQRRRLRRNKFTSKSDVFPTWAPLPDPKEMKASLSKVQALKFILQNAASKLRFFQTSILKSYLLSPILPTCSTSSFQKLVEKVQNYIKEV